MIQLNYSSNALSIDFKIISIAYIIDKAHPNRQKMKRLLNFFSVLGLILISSAKKENGDCDESMFSASSDISIAQKALLSCQAQHAFQRNWYPDPIQGKAI